MNKEMLKGTLSRIDLRNPKLSLDQECINFDKILAVSKIEGEQADLFRSILLVACCAASTKDELLKILKDNQKPADLSATLLVDVDTRYELLLSHSEWLLANCGSGQEFDLKLRSGVRLSEEFFSDLIFKVSKVQRTLVTELGVSDERLKASSFPTLIRNLNTVNDYLSELLGRMPRRYDPLADSLLGV